MKKIAMIFVALTLFSAISSAAQAAVAAAGRIYVVSGNVFVTQGKNPAHRVSDNEVIASNTLIVTGDKSTALLKFEDGQIVTMQANSAFRVREYRYEAKQIEKSNIVFSMLKGGMRFITGLIGQQRKQAFRLLTPNATIGIRGTEFMVTMVDNAMYGQVLTGNIGMTNAAGVATLGAGQSAVVASSGALVTLISASKIPAGTFGELLSIPTNPLAISTPAPAPVEAPTPPVPDATSATVSKAATSAIGAASASAGAAASVTGAAVTGTSAAGVSIGKAGGGLAGVVVSDSDSKPAVPEPAVPVASPPKSAAPAKEDVQKEMVPVIRSGKGITGKIGTLGYGLEYNLGISDRMTARFGLNAYTYKYNADSSTVNYDFKLKLQSLSALADWYPFKEGFRASSGLFYNNNKVTLDAMPGAAGYTINGTTFAAADVGTLQGTISFNKLAPYIGMGWGNPVAKDKGWGVVFDIGALFQNQPKTSLVATCGTGLSALDCNTLQANVAAENTKLQNDLSGFRWWPVLSIGASYQW